MSKKKLKKKTSPASNCPIKSMLSYKTLQVGAAEVKYSVRNKVCLQENLPDNCKCNLIN